MGLIQATIETLASVLGCRQDQAEDVVHSPARAAMSRRGFFMAAGAVAAGVVMLDAAPVEAAYTHNIRAVQGPGYVSLQAYDAYLKAMYSPDRIRRAMIPDQPLLKMVRRREGAYTVETPGLAPMAIHPQWAEAIRADDHLFLSGDRPQSQDLWRFQDDTRELVCSSRRK